MAQIGGTPSLQAGHRVLLGQTKSIPAAPIWRFSVFSVKMTSDQDGERADIRSGGKIQLSVHTLIHKRSALNTVTWARALNSHKKTQKCLASGTTTVVIRQMLFSSRPEHLSAIKGTAPVEMPGDFDPSFPLGCARDSTSTTTARRKADFHLPSGSNL